MTSIPVHADVHSKLVELLDEPVEYGGTLKLNKHTGTLDLARWQKGLRYDEVGIPAGLVQWHTHPRNCSPTRCTLGIPSGPDLAGFAKAAINNEALAHLVYSADGVYGILVDPVFLRMAQTDKQFADKFTQMSQTNFNAITEDYVVRRVNYPEFQNRWFDMVNTSGFKVKLFPVSKRPAFLFDAAV